MSIEKYLENIKISDTNPGPYAIRLKYELKKKIFEKNSSSFFLVLSNGFALIMLVLIISFIVKPDLADKIHYAFNSNSTAELDDILAQNQGQWLGERSSISKNNSAFFPVNDLSTLDAKKSYIIKRVQDSKNRSIFYVSEVKDRKVPKRIY